MHLLNLYHCRQKMIKEQKILFKNFSSSAINNVKILSFGMNADIHASADYRANMVKVFAKKAVEAC